MGKDVDLVCFFLKTFASSLDPDQTRQNPGSNLDTLVVFQKEVFRKSADNLTPVCKDLKVQNRTICTNINISPESLFSKVNV